MAPLRFARNVAGDAAPIVLAADQIFTWYESEQTVAVVLRGKVYIQQSTVQVRCEQAVARFDMKTHKDKGIWLMDLYAEGQVRLDTSSDSKEGLRAVVDLATRGEIKLHSVKNKAVQQPQADDPLYRRALAERVQLLNQPTSSQGPIQPVGLPVPLPPTVPGPTQPRYTPGPAPLPPTPAPVKPLGMAPGRDTVIVRAAAPDTDPAGQETTLPNLLAQAGPPDPPPPAPNNVPPAFPPPGPSTGGPAVVPPLTGPPPIGPPSKPSPGPPGPNAALAPGRTYSVRPRFGADFQFRSQAIGNGENAYIITGGVILNVRGRRTSARSTSRPTAA